MQALFHFFVFKVYDVVTIPAKLIGFSCREDGIIKP